MQVYVIESYYDLERQGMLQQGVIMIVTKERGQQLIDAKLAVKMFDL